MLRAFFGALRPRVPRGPRALTAPARSSRLGSYVMAGHVAARQLADWNSCGSCLAHPELDCETLADHQFVDAHSWRTTSIARSRRAGVTTRPSFSQSTRKKSRVLTASECTFTAYV